LLALLSSGLNNDLTFSTFVLSFHSSFISRLMIFGVMCVAFVALSLPLCDFVRLALAVVTRPTVTPASDGRDN
jgi:hypothetical protein